MNCEQHGGPRLERWGALLPEGHTSGLFWCEEGGHYVKVQPATGGPDPRVLLTGAATAAVALILAHSEELYHLGRMARRVIVH